MITVFVRRDNAVIPVLVGGGRGPKGAPGSPGEGYEDRADLKAAAAGANDFDDFVLVEPGREGRFVFRAGDFAALVAADTEEGLYMAADGIAPNLGALVRQYDGSINAEWFGLSTANSAAANVAVIDAMVDMLGDGPTPVQIEVSGKPYPMNEIAIEAANLHFLALGATFTGPTASFVTSPAAHDTGIVGGKFIRTDGGLSPVLHLNGPRAFSHGTWIEKAPEAGGYMAMFERNDALSGKCRVTGLTLRGGNGIFLEGPGHHFSDIDAVALAAGGDDFLVFKARNAATVDCVVEGIVAEGYSNVVAFGSEVGTLGAASAGRAGRVQNCRVTGVARKCTFGVFIKPGAIDAGAGYDWRDGLVADNFIHLQIADPAGNFMERPGVISASRGALVCDNKIVLQVSGRVRTNAVVRRVGLDFYIPDYSAAVPPAAAPTIRDNRCELHFDDPYNGVANGVGGAPGHPIQSFVRLEKQTDAHGTFARNRVSVFANGSSNSGIFVGTGCDDGLIVERSEMRAVNTLGGGQNDGGIYAASRLTVGPDQTIEVATGAPYRIVGGAEVLCPELAEEVYLFGQVNAGNGDTQYPWAAKRRCKLSELALNSTVAIAASDADYTNLQFRNIGATGNVFLTPKTKATGAASNARNFTIAAGAYSTLFKAGDLDPTADAGVIGDTLFAKDAQLLMQKVDTGAGRTLANGRLRVRCLPY